jgi:hypothetical protein
VKLGICSSGNGRVGQVLSCRHLMFPLPRQNKLSR